MAEPQIGHECWEWARRKGLLIVCAICEQVLRDFSGTLEDDKKGDDDAKEKPRPR